MIIQRYTQTSIFETIIPEDIAKMSDELQKIDLMLDSDEIIEIVETAILKKYPKAKVTGRPGTSIEARVRLLLLKHMNGWSFDDVVENVNGSIPLRQFTRLYTEKMPDVSRLKRWMKEIGEKSIKEIHELVIEIAKNKKVIRGRRLRSDTTAVETNVHYPTDGTLLQDAIRKIGDVIQNFKEQGVKIGKRGRNFGRCVKRKILRIVKFARGRGEKAKVKLQAEYKELMKIAKQVIGNIKEVKRIATRKAKQTTDFITKATIDSLKQEIDIWKEMLGKVLTQTEERIIKGNTKFKDKILSIFEPHTIVIRKGKAGKPNEFGRKVEITESENKIITDYKILEGNMPDTENLPDIIDRHKQRFKKPPDLVAHDRGGWSKDIEKELHQKGVKKVSIPTKGKKSKKRKEFESQRWFKEAQKFRAGSEGTISKLKRKHKLTRNLYKGEEGMEMWVGMGVIVSNLVAMAKT